jgi:hypothetical protein
MDQCLRANQPSHPLFEVVKTSAGAISIRNKVVNEIMHNPVGPWVEANALYVEPSRLRARLAATDPGSELVTFDVGLGAAANALAALRCAEDILGASGRSSDAPASGARFRLVSFERDLELLRFALDRADSFAHFQGFEPALEELLARKSWSRGPISWELRHGDFLRAIAVEPFRPHLIYFDPYSPKMNREMWSTACFQALRAVCREPRDGGTLLCTYSQATPVRAALLLAGFFVGRGVGTGLKEETTQAATGLAWLDEPLGERWLGRWERSHTPYPLDCEPGQEATARAIILAHPQLAEKANRS